MGRRKRNSRIIEQANERLNGLKTIDPALDLGNGLSVTVLEQAIGALRSKLDGYNQKLSELDEDLLVIETDENKLEDMNGRFLAGVGARFGRNSIEYEKAGGVRSDDRKRPASKKGSKSSS
jgi:hypothetical protein